MGRYAGYVTNMGEKKNAYRFEGKRPLGRHRHRWENKKLEWNLQN
jgi:hypothetical protein